MICSIRKAALLQGIAATAAQEFSEYHQDSPQIVGLLRGFAWFADTAA